MINVSLRNEDKVIKHFQKFFICDKETMNKILLLKSDTWQHPLITIKNRCIFCLEKNNLNSHLNFDTNQFFTINNIKIRKTKSRNLVNSEDENSVNKPRKREFSDTYLVVETKDLYMNSHSNFQDEENINIKDIQLALKKDYTDKSDQEININLKAEENEVIKSRKEKTFSYVKSYFPTHINEEHNHVAITTGNTVSSKKAVTGNVVAPSYLETVNLFHESHKSKLKKDKYAVQNKNSKNEYCDICFSDIKEKFTLSCSHFYCKECITIHITNCLNNITQFKNLKCPKAICNIKINDNIIHKIVSFETFEKYLRIKARIEGLSNYENFPCPMPDCESYGLRSQLKKEVLICITNKHTFCIKCLKVAHPDRICLGDKEDENLIMICNHKFIKKCPHCNSWVEKEEEGCNNVTCANTWCNYTFCWICLKAYDKTHYVNPLSQCFGLSQVNISNTIIHNKYLRFFKCFIMFWLLLAILPLLILLFSFIVVGFYILAFVLDGSAVKNVKLKTEKRQKLFKFLVSAIYFTMSLPLTSLGYISISFLIISLPFVYLIKKCKSNKDENVA